MKVIFFLAICIFLSCNSTEKINGFLEHDRTCRKYEGVTNVTFVYNSFDPILKVSGKWRELSMNSRFYGKSKNTISISNQENEIMYLNQFKMPTCKPCEENKKNHPERENSSPNNHIFSEDSFLTNLKRKIVFWRDYEKYTINLLETNEENYAVYSLSRTEGEKCVLIGIKNQIYYEFTLIESNLDDKLKSKILSDSFKLN